MKGAAGFQPHVSTPNTSSVSPLASDHPAMRAAGQGTGRVPAAVAELRDQEFWVLVKSRAILIFPAQKAVAGVYFTILLGLAILMANILGHQGDDLAEIPTRSRILCQNRHGQRQQPEPNQNDLRAPHQ